MEDSHTVTMPLNVEHQATEKETMASTKVEDEGSPCMYFQAQSTADVTAEEDIKSVETVEAESTEDHRSSEEGVEHEDISSKEKNESVELPENPDSEGQGISTDNMAEALTEIPGSSTEACVTPEEEAICDKHPESTDLQGESSQVTDDAAEKKMEDYPVEETVQQEDAAKHEQVLEHGEGETCSSSTSEDHNSKEDSQGNQEDLSSQSNIGEPQETTDSTQQAEADVAAGDSSTDVPVITVESIVATQSHDTESPSSDTKDAPDCQTDHNESQHPAEDTEEKSLEVSDHGSPTAAQEDVVKAADDPVEVTSSEEQGSAETAGTESEGCSGCHIEEHTHVAKDEKEELGL
ncbi:uncharacterized protein [Pleurodeles waltl]|uniref:uncharacterized protein n=1 Tax=Pleurodeles waltl TaxID=8319 RepID=UPI003709A49A